MLHKSNTDSSFVSFFFKLFIEVCRFFEFINRSNQCLMRQNCDFFSKTFLANSAGCLGFYLVVLKRSYADMSYQWYFNHVRFFEILCLSKILPMRRNLSLRHKNRKWSMKSLDSREVTNEISGFLYLWRSDKIRRIDRIFDIVPWHAISRIQKWN